MRRRSRSITVVAALAAACAAPALAQDLPFRITELADFDVPWSMAMLPDGRVLVTEQRGKLKLYSQSGAIAEVSGVPEVSYGAMGMRIRAVEQALDGSIYILEDEREGRGGQGRMFRLTARN